MIRRYVQLILICCVALTAACTAKPPRPMVEVGAAMPFTRFELTSGEWLTTEDLKGKNVAVQFWAADCNQSGSAISKFNKEALRHKDQKDRVYLAVSADTKRNIFEERITAQKINGPLHAFSGNGGDDEAYVAFGVKGLPQGFVIDKYGTVVDVASTASLE